MQVSLERGESDENFREPLLPATNDLHLIHNPRLPLALRLLYGLNGVTLSLPITPLLYIVNTRAAIPLSYLSAYGAIAFLPCSLKPFYAYMSQTRRNALLIALLIASGVCNAATSLIPQGSIVLCFLFGFSRGVTGAWSEFLLGRALVEHASRQILLLEGSSRSCCSSFQVTTAHYLQSEAATARNFGSTVATLAGFLFFVRYPTLNDVSVRLLLVTTGILHLAAAMIAFLFQVGSEINTPPPQPYMDHHGQDNNDDSISSSVHTNSHGISVFRGNCLLIVIFQIAIIVLSLHGPIIHVTSETCWTLCVMFLVVVLLLSIWKWPISLQYSHCVGLFLMARHSIPTCDTLMESFIYSMLKSKPMLLQALSLIHMGIITTLSSWSYGKLFAKQQRESSLVLVIAGTTVASSLMGLGNLVLVGMAHTNDLTLFFMLVLVIGSITTFVGQWQFLPDVVLATATTVRAQQQQQQQHDDDPFLMEQAEDESNKDSECEPLQNINTLDLTGMLYGTLISCIDFGDQIGAWLTVPLVTMLGISRDNDWANLDIMIIITSVLGLMSVLLLWILKHER